MSSQQQALSDRTLVVSGGSRGIGLAIALGRRKRVPTPSLSHRRPASALPGTVHTGGRPRAVAGEVSGVLRDVLGRPPSRWSGRSARIC